MPVGYRPLQAGSHGARLRAGLLFVNRTCRQVVERKRNLPPLTLFAAVLPSAKLVSLAACRGFPGPEFCDARADFIQDAIPTVPPVARAAKPRRAHGPSLVLPHRLHALASSRCAACKLRRTARRRRGGVSARSRN